MPQKPELGTIRQHLGAGMAITQDGQLISVNTPTARQFLMQDGHGYAPHRPTSWHPSGMPKRKPQPTLVQPPAIGFLPFHFGYNAGGAPSGTPGGYTQANGIITSPEAWAQNLIDGQFLNLHRFGYLADPYDSILDTLVESQHLWCSQFPRVTMDTMTADTFLFTRTVLANHLTYLKGVYGSVPGLENMCDKGLATFTNTGSESSGTYTGGNIDSSRSGWYGDEDGYYYLRTVAWKNPLGGTGNQLREVDCYGVSLCRQRQYAALSYMTEANLYYAPEQVLAQFAPLDGTFGFHGAYQLFYASTEFPSANEADHTIQLTATLDEEDDKFDAFPYRYTVEMVVGIDWAVPDVTLTWEWWLPYDVPKACTIRRYHHASEAPEMTVLENGLGSWDWAGTLTRNYTAQFFPYVAFALSLPANAKKRFDFGGNV
jgi:hypothetical protein